MKRSVYVLAIIIFAFSSSFATTAISMTGNVAKNDPLWVDTIMYAGGHAFGYEGYITEWGGWCFDDVRVGDDRILRYDSVGPTLLKLDLVTRSIVVDLAASDARQRIEAFFQPLKGFRRLQKRHKECLDSVVDETYGIIRCMGSFSFSSDYAAPAVDHAATINRYICFLAGASENIMQLPDNWVRKTVDSWKREEGLAYEGSVGSAIDIRVHIVNPLFATFGLYVYDREGTGHGMYTETFHSMDPQTGKSIDNEFLFKQGNLDQVARLLFEAMANDEKYTYWNPHMKSADAIEHRFMGVGSSGSTPEQSEQELSDESSAFELPQGALTNSGVVFSFQPYEIDCWAAGAYHFIVPYDKLQPYLTPEAQRVISAIR